MLENLLQTTVLPVTDKDFEQIITKQLVGMFDHHLEHNLTAYRKLTAVRQQFLILRLI